MGFDHANQPRCRRLGGWSPTEAIDRPLGEVFPLLDRSTEQAAIAPVSKVLTKIVVHWRNPPCWSRAGNPKAVDYTAAPSEMTVAISPSRLVVPNFSASKDHTIHHQPQSPSIANQAEESQLLITADGPNAKCPARRSTCPSRTAFQPGSDRRTSVGGSQDAPLP